MLVRNHSLISLDLIGSSFDLLVKPVPLHPGLIRGLRAIPGIEQTITQIQSQVIEKEEEDSEADLRKVKKVYQDFLHNEMFGNDTFGDSFFTAESHFFNFGYCDSSNDGYSREVPITNNTAYKASVFWTRASGDLAGTFSVNPDSTHIEAGET